MIFNVLCKPVLLLAISLLSTPHPTLAELESPSIITFRLRPGATGFNNCDGDFHRSLNIASFGKPVYINQEKSCFVGNSGPVFGDWVLAPLEDFEDYLEDPEWHWAATNVLFSSVLDGDVFSGWEHYDVFKPFVRGTPAAVFTAVAPGELGECSGTFRRSTTQLNGNDVYVNQHRKCFVGFSLAHDWILDVLPNLEHAMSFPERWAAVSDFRNRDSDLLRGWRTYDVTEKFDIVPDAVQVIDEILSFALIVRSGAEESTNCSGFFVRSDELGIAGVPAYVNAERACFIAHTPHNDWGLDSIANFDAAAANPTTWSMSVQTWNQDRHVMNGWVQYEAWHGALAVKSIPEQLAANNFPCEGVYALRLDEQVAGKPVYVGAKCFIAFSSSFLDWQLDVLSKLDLARSDNELWSQEALVFNDNHDVTQGWDDASLVFPVNVAPYSASTQGEATVDGP